MLARGEVPVNTSKCEKRDLSGKPDLPKNVPNPTAVGILCNRMAKNITRPSWLFYCLVKKLKNSDTPRAIPSASEWITRPIVVTLTLY